MTALLERVILEVIKAERLGKMQDPCEECGTVPFACECNLNHSHRSGFSEGFLQASGFLMDESVKAFRRQEDTTANLLRKASGQLKQQGDDADPGVPK